MKKRKTLFIRLPQGSENIRIVKEIKLDDKNSIQFTLDDTFEETDTADRYDSKVFLCYQTGRAHVSTLMLTPISNQSVVIISGGCQQTTRIKLL